MDFDLISCMEDSTSNHIPFEFVPPALHLYILAVLLLHPLTAQFDPPIIKISTKTL